MSGRLALLPRYVVFKSEQYSKYMTCRSFDSLDFSGDSVLSPGSKFAIEVAATIGNGLQVHVRSCYTNKYLVQGVSCIAQAAKREEDTCKDTCTLFAPLLVPDGIGNNNKQTIQLRHVQHASGGSIMEVINWDNLVIFPSHGHVAFKGSNGKYLGGVMGVVDRHCQQFSVDDKNQDLASYTVYPASNGNVRVYSPYFKKYWRVGPKDWISADGHHKCKCQNPVTCSKCFSKPVDPKTLFTPIKLDSNTIAFRSVANNKFLRSLDMDGKTQCLNASATTITDSTRIRVEELVMSRSIYNIVYRQQHARIYDETPIVCGTGAATNDSNQEDTMAVLVEYTETKSTNWETSISLSLGVSTTIKVAVPFIADGNINFNTNVTGGHKWGVKEDVSLKMSTTYTAKIGAKKQVKVSYVASKGTCDVPFSYTQEDVFTDGTREITVHDDGMFTGINCYNYSFKKQEDPL